MFFERPEVTTHPNSSSRVLYPRGTSSGARTASFRICCFATRCRWPERGLRSSLRVSIPFSTGRRAGGSLNFVSRELVTRRFSWPTTAKPTTQFQKACGSWVCFLAPKNQKTKKSRAGLRTGSSTLPKSTWAKSSTPSRGLLRRRVADYRSGLVRRESPTQLALRSRERRVR